MMLPIATDTPFALGPLLSESLRLLWRERLALLRALALPLALILLLSLLGSGAPPETDLGEAPAAEDTDWITLLILLGDLYALAIFQAAWYRFLLGYGEPRLWPGLDVAQLRLFARLLLFLLVPLAPALLLEAAGFAPAISILAALALLYMPLRWSLVLPAVSVGVPLRLAQSWRATRGKVLPLLLAPLFGLLAIGGVLSAPLLLLAGFFVPGGGPPGAVAAFLLWLEFGFLALVIVAQAAAVLALAVVRLVPDPQTV